MYVDDDLLIGKEAEVGSLRFFTTASVEDMDVLGYLLQEFHDSDAGDGGHYGNRPEVCVHPTCREATQALKNIDWR